MKRLTNFSAQIVQLSGQKKSSYSTSIKTKAYSIEIFSFSSRIKRWLKGIIFIDGRFGFEITNYMIFQPIR